MRRRSVDPPRCATRTGRPPDYLARDALADGTLVRVLPDHDGDTVDAHALHPRHRSLSAKVRAFVDALTAHLAASRPK